MSMPLLSLAATGRRLVTPELARGELDRHPPEAWDDHVQPVTCDVDLAKFDASLDELLAEIPPHTATMDARAAPEVHRTLLLSRREAADPGLWRFLTVVHRPDFVRHRWEFLSWPTMRDRFWRVGMRHDSNAFSRLWWIAELTSADGDYSLTEQAFGTQSVAIQVFIRKFAHYRPATVACIEALNGQPGGVVEIVLRRFNAWLSTVPLEGRSESQLRGRLDHFVSEARAERDGNVGE